MILMGMIFKFDMLKALKDKGYTTYKIREKKISDQIKLSEKIKPAVESVLKGRQ